MYYLLTKNRKKLLYSRFWLPCTTLCSAKSFLPHYNFINFIRLFLSVVRMNLWPWPVSFYPDIPALSSTITSILNCILILYHKKRNALSVQCQIIFNRHFRSRKIPSKLMQFCVLSNCKDFSKVDSINQRSDCMFCACDLDLYWPHSQVRLWKVLSWLRMVNGCNYLLFLKHI